MAKKAKLIGCDVIISRVSMYREEQPHPRTQQKQFVRIDRRYIDDPMKTPYIGKKWFDEGENHRVEDGTIVRDFPGEKHWVTQFDSIEDLEDFILEVGEVVISINGFSKEPTFEVEIYDSYRE